MTISWKAIKLIFEVVSCRFFWTKTACLHPLKFWCCMRQQLICPIDQLLSHLARGSLALIWNEYLRVRTFQGFFVNGSGAVQFKFPFLGSQWKSSLAIYNVVDVITNHWLASLINWGLSWLIESNAEYAKRPNLCFVWSIQSHHKIHNWSYYLRVVHRFVGWHFG